MLLACSHLLLASDDVPALAGFFAKAFGGSPSFENDMFVEYRTISSMEVSGIRLSGPPKTHPWGEKSFLLTDPDGNRWEIAQSPSADGMLTDR